MSDQSPYEIEISLSNSRGGRYRWNVYEAGKLRDSSVYPFASRAAAQADANSFVEKLIETWRRVDS